MPKLGLTKENLFARGAARFKDLVYLALIDKKLRKKDVAHTRLVSIDGGEIANVKDLSWLACGMCVAKKPEERLVVVSGGGDVFTFVGGDSSTERIAQPRDLRACTVIEGFAYACGMDRQVFCREREGSWISLHAPAAEGNDVVGFEAIGAFTRKDLYACGWQGEIWHFNGRKWSDCASPVNLILTGLNCAVDGHVYACGQAGTLLRGRKDKWELLETEGMTDDLWDLCWFDGKLYASSMTALYELQGDRLVVVDFGKNAPDSCYKLTAADGVMWSIGQESIFSFDGKSWQQWD